VTSSSGSGSDEDMLNSAVGSSPPTSTVLVVESVAPPLSSTSKVISYSPFSSNE